MNAKRALPTAAALWLATRAPAWAADVARADHSGLWVWAFLGLCALIVLAQLAPALMLLVGLVRGAAESWRLARAEERE